MAAQHPSQLAPEADDDGTLIDFYLESYFDNVPLLDSSDASEYVLQSTKNKEKKGKTLTLGLILCLNLGVTPPDVVKTHPCAVKEAWIDPTDKPKAMDLISSRLTSQYLRWQPKAKFRQAPDPTLDEVKRLCMALRRRAKEECVLLHFNGHGVPRPTENGELWVFNKTYTQYLPASIYDIQGWVGSPTIFVYDCSGAGVLIDQFNSFARKRQREFDRRSAASPRHGGNNIQPVRNCLQLAACRADERLPTDPEYPADLFTACLTTPIEMALRWVFTTQQRQLLPGVTLDMIDEVPGLVGDRSSMRGQLNWIFIAVTDTIAWDVLSSDMFQRIFRNDLLAAALFRNFLLAERVMRDVNCTPCSDPPLPRTHDHPMWQAWDFAVDFCLAQLPGLLTDDEEAGFMECPFFSDQLTAFEVWLMTADTTCEPASGPEQLPVLLQVLLSQQLRVRALDLLNRFMALGPWAVDRALAVGIFPYVFKLLGSPAAELQELLVSLWSKLLAVDPSRKSDLLKPATAVNRRGGARATERGFAYFLKVLDNPAHADGILTEAAYVLAVFLEGNPQAQEQCFIAGCIGACLHYLDPQDTGPKLRMWACLVLGKLFNGCFEAQQSALQLEVHERLLVLLHDTDPNTRAAATYALGNLIYQHDDGSQAEIELNINCIGVALTDLVDDGSHVVRTELAAAFSPLVVLYTQYFVDTATSLKEEELGRQPNPANDATKQLIKCILQLASDPFNTVADAALTLLSHLGIRATKGKKSKHRSASRPRKISDPVTVAKKQAAESAATGSPSSQGSGSDCLGNSYSSPLSWCQSYVQYLPSQRVHSHRPVRDDLQTLVDDLAQAAQELERKQQGVSGSPDVDLKPLFQRMRTLLSAAPALARSLKAVGWTGNGFDEAPTAALLRETISTLRSYMSEASQPGASIGLKLIHTQFADWCVASYISWAHDAPNGNHYNKQERRDWQVERFELSRQEAERLGFVNERHYKPVEPTYHKACQESFDMMLMHPYEPFLMAGNSETNSLTCFPISAAGGQPWSFPAGANNSAPLSTIKFLNADTDALLLCGFNDGVVRLWRDWKTETPVVSTAWRAVSRLKESRDGVGAGLVVDWDAWHGRLLAGGDVSYIQIWDGATEQRLARINSDVQSCLTHLRVDAKHPNTVYCGYGNGIVRLYDLRIARERSKPQEFAAHQSWILNVHPCDDQTFMSGSKRGDILWFDVRKPGIPIRKVQAHRLRGDNTMSDLQIHDYAPMFATASTAQYLKIFSMQGELLHHHKHYTNFLGEAIGPIASLAFHPYQPVLAACSYERLLTVFSPAH
eukprot:m.195251 g.195251  ORF g.195251 m.195251 type:complete len:1312 (-) comp16999_c0_seq1:102-4037(-)